jgi:hypothetical protein
MKNLIYILTLLFSTTILFTSCGNDEIKKVQKPSNYTVIIDLSDRILASEQLDKDFYLIEKYFATFEKNARRNLVLTSKDRFTIKIIPQKNSPLNVEHYEDLLQLNLDETDVKDKNKSLLALSQSLPKVLAMLKKEALFDKNSTAYFGVDIWAYLHDSGMEQSKLGYNNTVLVITDGYFDFESEAHVIKDKNKYTSTRFLNELTGSDWLKIATEKKFGLLPIKLEKQTKWIIAGLSGKKANDILQTEKITYFWKNWLSQSGVSKSNFILNSSKTEMSSMLLQQIQ